MQNGTQHFTKILAYTYIAMVCNSCNLIYGALEPGFDYTSRDIRLKNGSSHRIQVKAYINRKLLDDFVLEKNAEKVNKVTSNNKDIDKYNIYNVFKFDSLTSAFRDSIIIIFDDKKQIIQTCGGQSVSKCEDIPKNLDIIAQETNKWRKNKRSLIKSSTTSFTCVILTDEDFDRAVPIVK
jgi:hypothetical protein